MPLAVYRDDVVKAYSTEMARQPRKTISEVSCDGEKML